MAGYQHSEPSASDVSFSTSYQRENGNTDHHYNVCIMMLYYCYVLHIPIHTPLYHTHSLYVLIQKDLAANITEEQGKTLADAEGDVLRGLRKLLLSFLLLCFTITFASSLFPFQRWLSTVVLSLVYSLGRPWAQLLKTWTRTLIVNLLACVLALSPLISQQ